MDPQKSGIKYETIISHTFPGIIIVTELILLLDIISPLSLIEKIFAYTKTFLNFTLLIILLFVASTISGIIIDAIQHLYFSKFVDNKNAETAEHACCYAHIKTNEQLSIYRYIIDENEWYYYECYINIAISLIPSFFVLPCCLLKIGTPIIYIIFAELLLAAIFLLLFYSSHSTYKIINELHSKFIKSNNLFD